jgi:hypothetical protein
MLDNAMQRLRSSTRVQVLTFLAQAHTPNSPAYIA